MFALFALIHGTTLHHAKLIIAHGPNPRYREHGGLGTDEGFSTYLDDGPYLLYPPEVYARGKVAQYQKDRARGTIAECPDMAVPVILVIENVPAEVLAAADRDGYFPLRDGLVQFDTRAGIEELLAAWPVLTFHIRNV